MGFLRPVQAAAAAAFLALYVLGLLLLPSICI
jgi:hypothetical protein